MTTPPVLPLLPYRIVCQKCSNWDNEQYTILEAGAVNRVLRAGPSTGVENRCNRNTVGVGTPGMNGRCGGLLKVEA